MFSVFGFDSLFFNFIIEATKTVLYIYVIKIQELGNGRITVIVSMITVVNTPYYSYHFISENICNILRTKFNTIVFGHKYSCIVGNEEYKSVTVTANVATVSDEVVVEITKQVFISAFSGKIGVIFYIIVRCGIIIAGILVTFICRFFFSCFDRCRACLFIFC